jgi:hypothetical protein
MKPNEEERHGDEDRRKVPFDVFVWVITILSSVMLMISGYLFSEVATLRTQIVQQSGQNEGQTKELAAKFEAEKEKGTSVLITLAEIKGELKRLGDQLERRVTPPR